MKLNRFTNLLVIGLIVTVAATGCKKKTGFVTPLPANMGGGGVVKDPRPEPAPPLGTDPNTKGTGNEIKSGDIKAMDGVEQNAFGKHEGWPEDRAILESSKVYFAFDSASVRPGEASKLTAVVDYLKANADKAVKVEGHCDERGTEAYNLSLGDRRSVSLREELIKLGIDPTRVDTITFGEARPASTGHDEAAWKLNRRGEFIVLSPPK